MDNQADDRPTGGNVWWWIIAIIIIVAIVIALARTARDNGADIPADGTVTPTTSGTTTTSQGTVKTFTVTGQNFSFSPKEMRVNRGDRVRVNFVNATGTHDWVLDAFDVRTPIIQGGRTATVEFVADETGTFEYYCSVGNHRQMGMRGNLIVQ